VIDGTKTLTFQSDDGDLAVHTVHVFAADHNVAFSYETASCTINVTLAPQLATQLAELLAQSHQDAVNLAHDAIDPLHNTATLSAQHAHHFLV